MRLFLPSWRCLRRRKENRHIRESCSVCFSLRLVSLPRRTSCIGSNLTSLHYAFIMSDLPVFLALLQTSAVTSSLVNLFICDSVLSLAHRKRYALTSSLVQLVHLWLISFSLPHRTCYVLSSSLVQLDQLWLISFLDSPWTLCPQFLACSTCSSLIHLFVSLSPCLTVNVMPSVFRFILFTSDSFLCSRLTIERLCAPTSMSVHAAY